MSIMDKYTYEGLGFPIELRNVEMVEVKNYELPHTTEMRPLINIREVSDQAIQILLTQSAAFTGNQIGFIRVYFKLDENELAQTLNKKIEDVQKWEKTDTQSAGMEVTTQDRLKQYIRNAIDNKSLVKAAKESDSPGKWAANKGLFGPVSKESVKPAATDNPANPRKKPKA